VTSAERAVHAASRARDLCLSLRRAHLGPRALARLRAGEAPALSVDELGVGIGLAWAAGDLALIRRALASLDPEVVDRDPVLAAFDHATRARVAGPPDPEPGGPVAGGRS
jgi:hypothetical protein